MLNYTQLFVAFATALVVALLSAWVTVQLAYRRFRKEKWWERKFDTYDRVIDALYQTKEVWDSDLKALARRTDLSDEEQESRFAQYDHAKRDIERAVALGEYVLGTEARIRLEEYRREISSTAGEDWPQSLLDSLDATNECLDDLIRLARQDLGANDVFRRHRGRRDAK